MRVLRSTLVRGSGGSGAQRGGDGIVRELEFDEPVRLSWLSGRGERGAAGARGGEAARGVGGAWVRSGEGAARRRLAAQDSVELQRGARVEVRTPGGGGFGASN